MIEIEGRSFTGFAGFDAGDLPQLSYIGHLQWLKHRYELVFLTPFKKLVGLDSSDCYVWLCVTNLLCAAVEAFADFEFDGTGMERFSGFVEKYFSAEFTTSRLTLDDPRPRGNPPVAVTTPAQHLYKFFRCGLAHSFAIEWGGLRHREDGAPSYLFERTPMAASNSLGVVPRDLVTDFLNAIEKFFQQAASWKQGTPEANRFEKRFREVFLLCAVPTP
ncbi:MAG TPA: hypothetical protein VKZ53_17165 [Candidatus Angelobacter sp.]|nr:hypothetical protein [Candidatus Angelobacter sp.]